MMSLTKEDLSQIRATVKAEVSGSEKRLNKKIEGLDQKIESTEERLGQKIEGLDHKIESTEHRVIATLSREVSDLAEINRAVINRLDSITELEKRVMRLEHKVGIAS